MATRTENTEARNVSVCEGSDRISELPDHLIHHILLFVPTVNAVRMSVLSRRWRRMWYSVPTLQFSELDDFRCKKSFDAFVEQCLILRSSDASSSGGQIVDFGATGFKLKVKYRELSRHKVNRWLKSSIIRDSVKELDISALLYQHKSSFFDSVRLSRPYVALSGTSLSVVKLKDLDLVDCCSINLPSLKTLCLEYVTFDNDINETLHNLITRSPCLEKFVFRVLYDATTPEIKISSSSLKGMEIETGFGTVDIDALNLQSLVWNFYRCSPKGFSSCTAIRDLSLSGLHNNNKLYLEDQLSKLTCLETLNLTTYRALYHINVANPTLKCFSLTKHNGKELAVTTETPNLVSFEYQGDMGFGVTMATPNPQLSGSFTFLSPFLKIYDTDYCHTKLMSLFSNINCLWNSLTLCFIEEKDFTIPGTMRKTMCLPWPHLKHLKVTIRSRLTRNSELQNALEWLSPSLATLSIEEK